MQIVIDIVAGFIAFTLVTVFLAAVLMPLAMLYLAFFG